MDRKGYVIKTPEGETNVNKLRLPEFGVVAVQLKAGDKLSKVYVPAGAKAGGEAGSDDFHFLPEHETIEIHYQINNPTEVVKGAKLQLFTRFDASPLFSLDLETLGDTWIKHGKHVVKWDGRLPAAKSKVEGTYDKGKKVWNHDLTRYAVDTTKKEFPDGYVTLEHTPYKVKLTLTSSDAEIKGKPTTGWTYFHILLKKIEFELGEENTIPKVGTNARLALDKALRAKIDSDGGIPATGATRKVVLISNLYKVKVTTGDSQMNTNKAYQVFRGLWGDGPNIPIVAKIRLADSTDAEIKVDETAKGAVALGNVRFMWDWEDPAEDVDGVQAAAKPKTFIKDAINYYKDGTDSTRAAKNHTYPKGDNCHVDRGGKRGPDAKPVFPAQAGYDPKATLEAGKFPFKVITGGSLKKRKWASYSHAWTKGKLKGKTGVVFQPSRMAGDDFTLNCYLAYDKSKKDEWVVDAQDEPLKVPAQIKASTGKFQMWREVHVARFVRKKSGMTEFLPGKLTDINKHFHMAYVDLVDKMGGTDHNYFLTDHRLPGGTTPNYNSLLRTRLNSKGVLFTQNLATSSTADHKSVDSMILVRTYSAFVTRVHRWIHSGTAAAANDFTTGTPAVTPQALGTTNVSGWASNARNNRLKATRTWLRNSKLHTDKKYCKRMDDVGIGIGEDFGSDLKLISGSKNGVGKKAPPGVVTINFNYTNTALRDRIAAGKSSSYWYGAAVNATDADIKHCLIMYWRAGVDRFSHEFGHHLFLPHAKYPTGFQPGGFQVERHDDTDSGCMMSYSSTRPGFCGLCQLRMRGWDAGSKTSPKLNKISANNKKP